MSAWGWRGILRRALEFAVGYDGALVDEEVAPPDRMRFRYNRVDNRPEVSCDEGAYEPIALGAGGTNVATSLRANEVAITPSIDNTIATLDPFTPAGGEVVVTFTGRFIWSQARTLVLKFFKNGSEVDVSDEYTTQTPGAFPALATTVHFVDPSPTAGDVYAIMATADGAGVSVTTRRITAVG